MLAQSQEARDLEKIVIDTFNTKLAAKITAFKAANPGVGPRSRLGYYISLTINFFHTDYDLVVRCQLQARFHPRLANYLWFC